MSQLTKKIIVGLSGMVLAIQVEKIDKRALGHYPTPRQVGVLAGGAVALAYALAFIEQKVGLVSEV